MIFFSVSGFIDFSIYAGEQKFKNSGVDNKNDHCQGNEGEQFLFRCNSSQLPLKVCDA